eukprot:CAMPEP_0171970590 /NCGR_PEP_ID=MMETSP0993-20121228/213525_1 /TAXON_ID=483369 /ORGANISM="non described non described, Strain CCMP2098" /LENGTH=42 /DNA_ID= /DNA_START= /DNA_END= /DNA_ORIENTATION=
MEMALSTHCPSAASTPSPSEGRSEEEEEAGVTAFVGEDLEAA